MYLGLRVHEEFMCRCSPYPRRKMGHDDLLTPLTKLLGWIVRSIWDLALFDTIVDVGIILTKPQTLTYS
jgi:hypothetical protein